MGAINADVLLQLDERSARAVSDQLEQQFRRSGSEASSAFSDSFNRNLSSVTGEMERTGRNASSAFQRELDAGVRNAISSATSQFGSLGQVADSALSGISTKAAAVGLGIAGIAAGVAIAGKALYDLGKQWDSISDSMTVATGKTGDDLKQLTDIVSDVGQTTAASLGSIGSITQQISQSMPDLAQNNAAVRQMASNLAYLDANGKAVDIRQLGLAFNAFGIQAGAQVKALDELNSASQATGIPLNELISTVRAGAPQFRQFGLDIGQSTGLLASFAQAGVAPESAVTGLRIALKNLSTDARGSGAALDEAITQIKALHDAGNDPAAQQLAEKTFGRGFAPFLQAIETGTVNVQNLNRALTDLGMPLSQQQQATDDWSESFQKIKNTIQTGLKPVADIVFGSINEQLQYLAGNFGLASDKADELAESMRAAAQVPISPDSALGKMLTPGGIAGGSPPGIANAPLPYPTTKPSTPVTGLAPNPYKAMYPLLHPGDPGYAGNDNIPGTGSAASTAQVPYGALPAIASGVPMTSEVYSSQSSLWEANHNVEQKRAEQQRLQASNTAKAEDLVKAQNDVDKAVRDQHEAEMRFAKTQQDAYAAQFKQLNKAADALDSIGAKLDQDFGVSDGLAGVVENITKMIGNLAMAPVIGALTGVSVANGFKPGAAGSGLAGMLASSGAFGQQFVPTPGGSGQQNYATTNGVYSPSAMGPAALQPGPSSGVPYGLPSGANSGGYGGGGAQFPDWVYQLGNAFGLKPSTYPHHQDTNRNEAGYAPNPNHENRGIDWSGSPQNMQRFADYLKTVPGMEQVIWNGGGVGTGDTVEIAGGRPQPGYFAGDLAAHGNHVHTRQSTAIPLPGAANAGTGGGGGWFPSVAPSMDSSVAGAPGQGYPTPWTLGVGPGGAPPLAGGPGWLGGPSVPGIGSAMGQGLGGPAAPSQSVSGGRQWGADLPASQGIGFSGGVLGAAVSAAAGAAGGAGSFGAGGGAASAAAQLGIQEIGRAIGAGGQYAGNLAGGLLETFSLNESSLGDPSHSWLGRGLTAAAGVRPALPNANMLEAGKAKPPSALTPEQAQAANANGQGQGDQIDQSTHISVTNNRATEDGTGRDIQAHLGAQAMATAPR